MKIHFKQDSTAPCYLFPPMPQYPPQHHSLRKSQPRFSLKFENPVLYSYKTTSKIVILYIRVLNNEQEEKRF